MSCKHTRIHPFSTFPIVFYSNFICLYFLQRKRKRAYPLHHYKNGEKPSVEA